MPQFVTRKLHALIDYPVALGLIAAPFAFGVGMDNAIAFTMSIAAGIAALLLTAMTDHETGLLPVLSYRAHLAVDGLVGASFLMAPLVFGFTGIEMAYYLIVGATVLAVVALHKDDEVPVAHPAE
ncbi:MAG: hypothetical protein AAGF36_04325 [Pseudomonadota bacterium]